MEQKNNSRTKDIVLARAHRVYYLRPLFTRGAAAGIVLVVSLFILGRKVWVAQVIQNMPSPTHIADAVLFFESAFLNTTFVVQTLTIVSLGAGIWLAREFARLLIPQRASRVSA